MGRDLYRRGVNLFKQKEMNEEQPLTAEELKRFDNEFASTELALSIVSLVRVTKRVEGYLRINRLTGQMMAIPGHYESHEVWLNEWAN